MLTSEVQLNHYSIKINNLDLGLISNNAELSSRLDQLARKLNLTVLKKTNYEFQPQGLTTVYVLSESHLALHTWPEKKFAHLEILTCSGEIKKDLLHESVGKIFETKNYQIHTLAY